MRCRCLSQAVVERAPRALWVRVDPRLDPVRSDSAFRAVARIDWNPLSVGRRVTLPRASFKRKRSPMATRVSRGRSFTLKPLKTQVKGSIARLQKSEQTADVKKAIKSLKQSLVSLNRGCPHTMTFFLTARRAAR